MNSKLVIFLIILLVAASFLGGSLWTKVRYLEGEKQPVLQAEVKPSPAVLGEEPPQYEQTVGNFLILENEVCQENGRPIIYFFGSESCSHCAWEHPVFDKATAQFNDLISVHDNMDIDQDMEIFQQYSQINRGAIPFLLLGCQYARVGSGERSGEAAELQALTELICNLTGDKPTAVCQ